MANYNKNSETLNKKLINCKYHNYKTSHMPAPMQLGNNLSNLWGRPNLVSTFIFYEKLGKNTRGFIKNLTSFALVIEAPSVIDF